MNIQQKVAVAGDWHGDTWWATQWLPSLGYRGIRTVLHVGDFGIWPGRSGQEYLAALERVCARYEVTILVTPGNHEDWDHIDALDATDNGNGWGPAKWFTNHIAVLPRGHRFTLTTPAGVTRSFVSLGGAPSIDYQWRTPHRDWWPNEMMTGADVEKVAAAGYADIMVAHDGPDVPYATDQVADILRANPMGWSSKALAYATEGRELITAAYEAVAPAVFFHGHYHVHGTKQVQVGGRDAQVVALHMQRHAGNIVLLDLDTLQIDPV